jgi:hypothetical protein
MLYVLRLCSIVYMVYTCIHMSPRTHCYVTVVRLVPRMVFEFCLYQHDVFVGRMRGQPVVHLISNHRTITPCTCCMCSYIYYVCVLLRGVHMHIHMSARTHCYVTVV